MYKRIKIKISPSRIKGYNFDYIFSNGKRIYIERDIRRYLRVIEYLNKRGLVCL